MIPVLSHIERQSEIPFWITTDSKCGVLIRLFPVDSESSNADSVFEKIRCWATRQESSVLVRIIFKSEFKKSVALGSSRDEALSQIGHTSREVIVSLETHHSLNLLSRFAKFDTRNRTDPFEKIVTCTKDLKSLGTEFEIIEETEIYDYFSADAKSWVVCESFVDTGAEYKACVRINRPSASEQSCKSLEKILKLLPKPFTYQASFRKVGKAETQFLLDRKIRQSKSGTSKIDEIKMTAMERISAKTSLEGDDLFNLEIVFVLVRTDLQQLKIDLLATKNLACTIGDAIIETFASLPALASTQVGSAQHITFLELGGNLPFYLPVSISGSSKSLPPAKSAFLFHRSDESIGSIELLSTKHQNANAVVIGSSGRGKSAFVGSLTKALMNDKGVKVIKVDVGGSHSKECELLGGIEHRITMASPSGMNPFFFLKKMKADENMRSILINFISVLVLEETETSLPKAVRIELDHFLQNYIQTMPPNPSLDGFHKMSSMFSRTKLLSRWCGSGVFAKAFASSTCEETNAPLRYYNFAEIFQAADPDYAQAGMAAVLAQFNFEMQSNKDKRIVLICDETPFFIQKCFEFFKFSTANVRKFGASIILVVQMSKDLIVKGDSGVIENSYHRILMSLDGDQSEFRDRFRLSDEKMDTIKRLKTSPGEFSEFLYQAGDESFVGRLRLTANEYLQVTTSPADREKIQNLRNAVPGLTLKEVITCLAI